MLQAGTEEGIDPQAMMRQMMAQSGPLDTSQSGMNLESTRNNINAEFMPPPGMCPPPEIMQIMMGPGTNSGENSNMVSGSEPRSSASQQQ
jgi:hypothetical protein